VTDGQPVQTLLAHALQLSSVRVDDSAVVAAIAGAQVKLDRDAVTAEKMRTVAAHADANAAAEAAAASRAQAQYESLRGAVKNAVLFLYTDGPSTLTVNPAAGDVLAYARDYADSAMSPDGVLSLRSSDVKAQKQALSAARKAQKAASRAAAKAEAALAAEQTEVNQLEAELQAIAGASAGEILADHTSLASQAGNELLTAASLQFNPKSPLPAPLATTDVALEWAFAELGKPYVWGATGPNTFDCSGLTQFVWRQAGVAIPRVAADQYAWTIPVPLSQLLPGDLVFYGTTDIHHVGLYIGNGLMINAPHTGDVVRVSSIWWSDLAGFGRVHSASTPVPLRTPPTTHKPAKRAVVPTAGPVPSQTKPPPGWKPKPGSTNPLKDSPSPKSTTTTTTTTAPSTTTTTSTTVPPDTTTTVPATTTTVEPTPGPDPGTIPTVPSTTPTSLP
jgi:cell wall-associated NlpC family hydrolase